MALSVTAVSIRVSPLRIDDDDTDMFITSAPSRLPANSNEAWVRVEASKNILISVRPRSEAVFFSIWRLSSTNSPARSSRPTMSSRESPSIPSKWRLLRTNEDLWAMFIKASSYRRGGGLRQADRIAVHRHEWAGGNCDSHPGALPRLRRIFSRFTPSCSSFLARLPLQLRNIACAAALSI